MTKQRVTVEDLVRLKSVTNPELSPNNKEAVFVVTQIDEEDNTYYANLFHLQIENQRVTQWTFGKQRVSSPQWSADGTKLAFLSTRNEKKQLFVIQTTGGEAEQLTTVPYGVTSFRWSPCGTKIWINAFVDASKQLSDAEEEELTMIPQPYRVTTMKYKADSVGLLPQNRYKQVGSVSVETKEVEQFTEGEVDYTLHDVSNDGSLLILSRNEQKDFDFQQPLSVVTISTKTETVITDEQGAYSSAYFSKDDRFIAYVGSNRAFENATHPSLYVFDRINQSATHLTEALDAPMTDLHVADHQQDAVAPSVVWTDNNELYFQLSTMGDVRLYFATLDGAIYPATPEGEHVYGYSVANKGEFSLLAISTPTSPGELYLHQIATGDRKPVTTFNEKYVQEVELVQPEAIVVESTDETTVHGWLMKPANYVEGKRYPLIVEIHGGPHMMYANTFIHEMQLLAAEGYGVLYVNPRGSHGYSQAFVDAVRNNYGYGDYEDIIAALDAVIANNDWIDVDRLGVTGGSYGGFMTNWIVGHTNRFKAAVTQRSICNWVSFYGVSDIGYYFSEWQIGATIEDVETLWKHSPLKYVENVQTPLLILHSEKDYRCPIEQAEQLYIALKRLGKETEFVRFPEADHNLSRTGAPNLRAARLNEIVDWFKKYL